MTRVCGNVTGGWMRVAELDMTNSSHQCPGGFRTCVQNMTSLGCSSITFSTHSIPYSSVCGKVIGYQVGSTNAFANSDNQRGNKSIDIPYVDGISLTHGDPRRHIWTFAAALDEVGNTDRQSGCPCQNQNITSLLPDFVSQDYFCDTGLSNETFQGDDQLLSPDPLWDGMSCRDLCCSYFDDPPWFHKELPCSTSEDIEMRVCRDEPVSNEDIAIGAIEIYVQ
jgi:hypothetical protein